MINPQNKKESDPHLWGKKKKEKMGKKQRSKPKVWFTQNRDARTQPLGGGNRKKKKAQKQKKFFDSRRKKTTATATTMRKLPAWQAVKVSITRVVKGLYPNSTCVLKVNDSLLKVD